MLLRMHRLAARNRDWPGALLPHIRAVAGSQLAGPILPTRRAGAGLLCASAADAGAGRRGHPRCKHRYGTWREPLTTLALLGLGIVIRLLGEQSPACEEVARPVHVPLCAAMLTRRRPHLPSRPQAVTYGRRVDHFHLHRGSGLLLALRVLAVFGPAAPTAIFLLYFRFPTWWNLTAVPAAVLLPVRGPSACGMGLRG